MSRLEYDKQGLEAQINTRLESTKKNLSNACYYCNNFSVPSGFGYSSYLYGLYDVFNGHIKSIEKIYNKIQDGSKKISKLNDDHSLTISGIENYIIPLRKSAIK